MSVRGFSNAARALSEHYGETVSRQQVYQWWRRRTVNKDRQPFPRGRSIKAASAKRPSRTFTERELIEWARPGIPQQHCPAGLAGMNNDPKVFTPA
jgi:hypothetical protein